MARMFDNGDDRDIGGGFNPAGLRRNMETGEMYDPGTVSNKAVASPVKRSAVTPAQTAPRAPVAKEDYPSQDKSFNGPPVTSAYPDESRRGRMASANGSGAGQRVSAPGDVPGAFEAVHRYHQETTGGTAPYAEGRYPMTKPQPTENTYSRKMGAQADEIKAYRAEQEAKRRRQKLTSDNYSTRAPAGGAGRGMQGGPTAKELEKYESSKVGFKYGGKVKKMASGGMTVSKASSRADGIAQRGKTRGKIC